MGKSWDNTGIAYKIALWKEVLRVLKPGGHLLSFGGSRTYHRMACAIEDAGFEIRDQIMWVYGSGFPKSLNIGKAVDKLQGNEREVVGKTQSIQFQEKGYEYKGDKKGSGFNNEKYWGFGNDVTKGSSVWEGYGTALKPAHEPIVLARKPLSEKTVAENCLKWGVGGLAIDECRVNKQEGDRIEYGVNGIKRKTGNVFGKQYGEIKFDGTQGRFPANLIHDGSDEVVELFPDSNGCQPHKINSKNNKYAGWGSITNKNGEVVGYDGKGSAARFFYCAKASKSERDRGCERNNHPTVKPLALMKYLVKLISREGQTVLDPFMGSGTTGIACKELNRNFIGIEMNGEYMEIAKKRIG